MPVLYWIALTPHAPTCYASWTTLVSLTISSDRTMKSTLQHTATYCNTLQHTATNCTTLPQVVVLSTPKESLRKTLQHTATHYSTLQYTGSFERTTKFTLHHAATHCIKQDVQSAPKHTIKTWLMNVEMYKAEVMPCGVQQKDDSFLRDH